MNILVYLPSITFPQKLTLKSALINNELLGTFLLPIILKLEFNITGLLLQI